MKAFFILLFLIKNISSMGQYEPGFLPEFFFGRQPSAKSEAMGKANASIDGDLGSIYFNPAGISTIKSIEINTSYTPPNYYLTKGYYTFLGIGYKVNRHLQLAVSQFRFDFGKTPTLNAIKKPYDENNTLTLASRITKNLFLGLNTNLFVFEPGLDNVAHTISFDIGAIQKLLLGKSSTINLGCSVRNFSSSSVRVTDPNGMTTKLALPIICKYGLGYETRFHKVSFIDSVDLLKVLVQCDYQALLNSKYRSGVRFGAEINVLDLVSLRGGWYNETLYDFGFPNLTKSQISSFTYGIGLQIPLWKLIKTSFAINIDYTSLPQVNSSKVLPKWENFNTVSIRFSRKK